MNTFNAVNFLKCVVTEVVLFSVVAFDTDISQGSKATHLRCGGVVGLGSLATVLLQIFS